MCKLFLLERNAWYHITLYKKKKLQETMTQKCKYKCTMNAHAVMVIVVGNGHGDTSSNPGRD